MSSVIFYGAGQNARDNYSRWLEKGLMPVCFADSDPAKHHTFFKTPDGAEVEILPLLEAVARRPDYELYLTQDVAGLSAVRDFLHGVGVPPERIKLCDDTAVLKSYAVSDYCGTLYPRLHRIYNALQDDLSKALFMGRVEYSLSHNLAGIYRAMTHDDYMRWLSTKSTYAGRRHGLRGLWQLIRENYPVQKNDIYLLAFEDDWNEYGWVVERFLSAMPGLGIAIKGCVMPFAAAEVKEYMGVNRLPENAFLNVIDENTRIIIGFPGWCLQTEDIADRYAIHKDILFPIADTAYPDYFEPEIFQPSENEIFVDVGVYELSNSIDFSKWAVNGYDKIYAFEPDPNCYDNSLARLNEMDEAFCNKVDLVNKGLSAADGVLEFPAQWKGSGQYDNGRTVSIDVVSLDSFLNGRPATFVKMDVEGAEMDVLLGMQETIRNCKPKLAVCIYHKHEDVYAIASYMLGLVPEYKLYIRHYNSNETETVLFCMV